MRRHLAIAVRPTTAPATPAAPASTLLILTGLGMLRHALDMHLGRRAFIGLRRHRLLGCRRRRHVLTPTTTTTTAAAAVLGLLRGLARHGAVGIVLGFRLGLGLLILEVGGLFLRLDLLRWQRDLLGDRHRGLGRHLCPHPLDAE